MTNAKRDENGVPTRLATSNADGITPLSIQINATTHGVVVDDGIGGSDLSGDIASRDENSVPVMMAVSSVDGVTPVALYIDSVTGKLLTNSN